MRDEIRIGVVGYCPPTKFDEKEAARMICEAYNQIQSAYPNRLKTVVSGLTNVGVLKLAYLEARRRGWRTSGIACKKAENYELFPVDEKKIIGDNWGDESEEFLRTIDALIRIGGGKQSLRETAQAKTNGKLVLEYELAAS